MTKLDVLRGAFPRWKWATNNNGFIAIGTVNGLTLTVRGHSFTLNAEENNKVVEVFHGNCAEVEGLPALIDGIRASAAALFSIDMEQKTVPVVDLRSSQIESSIEVHRHYTTEGSRDKLPSVVHCIWLAFIVKSDDTLQPVSLGDNAVLGSEKAAIAAIVEHVSTLPLDYSWKRLYVQEVPVLYDQFKTD